MVDPILDNLYTIKIHLDGYNTIRLISRIITVVSKSNFALSYIVRYGCRVKIAFNFIWMCVWNVFDFMSQCMDGHLYRLIIFRKSLFYYFIKEFERKCYMTVLLSRKKSVQFFNKIVNKTKFLKIIDLYLCCTHYIRTSLEYALRICLVWAVHKWWHWFHAVQRHTRIYSTPI